MKVVLSEHVDHLGQRGEIVSVAPGYARNYLLPKRLAMKATPGNMLVLKQEHRVWETKEARAVDEAQALAERLADLELSFTKKAGQSGTLYGSVTNVEIAELLGAKGVEVDRRRIVLHEPVKTLGTHGISIRLHRKVTAELTLHVASEQGEPSAPSELREQDDE